MSITFEAVDGVREVAPGDDLAELVVSALAKNSRTLEPGDVVVITSKIVSKALGLATDARRDDVIAANTDRVVAQRGEIQIVRTYHGLTLAAAGVDATNTAIGTVLPLPPDPDGFAAQVRARIHELAGVRVAVIISDTAGRAWRIGQTDIAIGCAGLLPVESFAGRVDPYGNPLAVTAPAIADQIAGAAELASGKFGHRPVVVVRGADRTWLTEDDGPGATALIRDEAEDLFGLGACEAAVAAILGAGPVRGLPTRDVTVLELLDLALHELSVDRSLVRVDDNTVEVSALVVSDPVAAGALAQRLTSLGVAHGHPIDIKF
jgi:coenzyme F420-0:L-glutamate ligase/coenzyme F420-1:gamma-L-glutamate ligase